MPSLPLQPKESVSLLQRVTNIQQRPNLHALNSHFAQLRSFVLKFKLQQTEAKLIIRKTAKRLYVTAFPSLSHSLFGGAETGGRQQAGTEAALP